MSNSNFVKLEIQNKIAFMTLNRPEKLNAINAEMKQSLDEYLRKLENENDLRVVVIKGAGRAFCAGGDLGSIKRKEGMGTIKDLQYSQSILKRLINLKQVVIASVHGVATGAGCNLALAADLVYAAKGTKFGQPFIKVGLVPDWGGMHMIPGLAGTRKAKEWMLLGDNFEAEEAVSHGVINGVFENDTLIESVTERARKIAASPWNAVKLIKQTLNKAAENELDKVFAAELKAFEICSTSEDFQEGINAFFEGRKPNFK